MVQNPKGGGLSSSLGGSQMMGGVQKTTDFLDKSTWILAMILTALVLFSYLSFTDSFGDSYYKIIDTTKKATPETPAAATPATPAAPAQSAPTPAVPAKK
jgi:preprotein translocase subunit SecG